MKKIESIFRIEFEDEMVLQVLILCFEFWLSRSWYWDGKFYGKVNNNYLTWLDFWLGIRIRNQQRGNPRRESGIHPESKGVWDPQSERESIIPDSVPRENESQTGVWDGWMGWFPIPIRILGFRVQRYFMKPVYGTGITPFPSKNDLWWRTDRRRTRHDAVPIYK